MGTIRQIATIAEWEVRRLFEGSGRTALPLVMIMLAILSIFMLLLSQYGIHLQSGLYRVAVSDPAYAEIFSDDDRFILLSDETAPGEADLILDRGRVYMRNRGSGDAALHALAQAYERYRSSMYRRESDLAAAYPVWIRMEYVKGETDLPLAGGPPASPVGGQSGLPLPSGPVEHVDPPLDADVATGVPQGLVDPSTDRVNPISRLTDVVRKEGMETTYSLPSQLTPPMPLDSIVLIFIFVFPLYFTSQLFMMSVMNERIQRRGELLLSSPIPPLCIVAGKALPYLVGMLGISSLTLLLLQAPAAILLLLLPVILFFLASALLIGMLARSFKELSFISLFFSTLVTMYLFIPTVFTHASAISLLSPLTLVLLQLEGGAFSPMDYLYATSLFFLTALALFHIGAANFSEEGLFSGGGFVTRLREFIGGCLSIRHPIVSLFLLSLLLIPVVFMMEMLAFSFLFSLPMPLSLVILLIIAALIEEAAKFIGVYALALRAPSFLHSGAFYAACIASGAGFLAGEKLLLFAMLSQITESAFGAILFPSLRLLWYPLLLHMGTVLVAGLVLRRLGTRAYTGALLLATLVHALYNLVLVLGWWP